MINLRKHQSEFQKVIDDIIAGANTRDILLAVTPGGGKSSIPIITGKLKTAGLIDGLAWVVPRQALQDQGERGFLDPFFRRLFNHKLKIRSATNDTNPCRGTDGFVTTYQAMGVDNKKTVFTDFKYRRYALILDEFHHVEKDGIWHEALKPLYENATYVIMMTGTLERGDGKPIAFVRYRNNRPVLESSETTAVIRYNRRDALSEQAILPISFHLSDGQFKWENQEGQLVEIDSFEAAREKEEAAALYTALKTDFSDQLLKESLQHWQDHKNRNPRARMLVVTADYEQAKAVTAALKGAGLNSEIATSHQSKDAVQAIKSFKIGRIDILVTIAMAYEGLDVPQITHICSLTHIRSTPWIEQMVARGVRIDKAAGPYESQLCYVFAPKDNRMVAIMEQIRKEQAPVLGKRSKPEESEFEKAQIPGDGSGTPGPDITPLSSNLTGQTEHVVGLDGFQAELPFGPNPAEMETVKEQEDRLRRQIAKHVNAYAFEHRYKPQQINAEIKQKFGKAREIMSLPELKRVMAHIKEFYPAELVKTIRELPPGMEQYSKPRSKRKRVSAKAEKWTPRDEIMKMSCYDNFNSNPKAHIYR
jgi:superfamily II DNA or RNA helicase